MKLRSPIDLCVLCVLCVLCALCVRFLFPVFPRWWAINQRCALQLPSVSAAINAQHTMALQTVLQRPKPL
jgi:hypothetical protein